MRRLRRPTLAAFATVALALSMVAPASASGPPPPPRSDPFYQPPPGWATTARGAVLRSRPVTLATFATLPQKVRAWQLLYRTTSSSGAPSTTVTTVLAPASGRTRGLISYQIAEDASAPQCAPSYELRPGSGLGGSINQSELLLIDAAVAEGFDVSVPDYEGPRGEFGAARQPGYAILDGLRAAERFAPLGLPGRATPTAVWGYSGGSLASGWAAEVAPTYAPGLDLKGVAVGGFVTNLAQTITQINGGPGSGLIASVLSGVGRASPPIAAALGRYLTAAGKALVAKAGTQCVTTNVADYAGVDFDRYLTIPLPRLLALPAVARAVASMDLGSPAPRVPLFVYHAVHDELVPIAGPTATVARYCRAGDPVTFVRDELSEHLSLTLVGAPDALSWLTDRLTGAPVPHGCSTTTVPSMLATAGGLHNLPPFLLADITALLDQPVGSAEY